MGERVELPAKEKTLPPMPLTVDEVAGLMELVPGFTPAQVRNRAMLEVMYGCGLRRSEVVGLNVGDIDFSAETIFVRGKGQKDRVLPIGEVALHWVTKTLEKRKAKLRKQYPLFAV
ncbi:MAG: tyrosine-type recombinase/integrase, partial [Planctomycetota bacterium]